MYRTPNKFSLQSLLIKYGGLMKLTTPFTILNRKCNEMDLIRQAMYSRKFASKRLHNDYRKMLKNKEDPNLINECV